MSILRVYWVLQELVKSGRVKVETWDHLVKAKPEVCAKLIPYLCP